MITHAVGLSLGAASSIESGVAVREISTGKLIHVDKLFSMNDVQLFFDNYPSLKNSVICVSLPWDNTMLEGKWRILSKQYQLIHNDDGMFYAQKHIAQPLVAFFHCSLQHLLQWLRCFYRRQPGEGEG